MASESKSETGCVERFFKVVAVVSCIGWPWRVVDLLLAFIDAGGALTLRVCSDSERSG